MDGVGTIEQPVLIQIGDWCIEANGGNFFQFCTFLVAMLPWLFLQGLTHVPILLLVEIPNGFRNRYCGGTITEREEC